MRSRDVVILSHGTTVFTTDSRVEVNKTKRSLEAAAVSDQATRTAAAFIKYNLIRESIYILFQIKVNKAKYLTYLYTLSYFLFDGIAWISVRQWVTVTVTGAKTCHFYMFWHRHSHRQTIIGKLRPDKYYSDKDRIYSNYQNPHSQPTLGKINQPFDRPSKSVQCRSWWSLQTRDWCPSCVVSRDSATVLLLSSLVLSSLVHCLLLLTLQQQHEEVTNLTSTCILCLGDTQLPWT